MEENINTILKKAQTGDSEAIDWILKEYSKILSIYLFFKRNSF